MRRPNIPSCLLFAFAVFAVTSACGGGAPKSTVDPTPAAAPASRDAATGTERHGGTSPTSKPPTVARTLQADETIKTPSEASFTVASGWSIADAGGVFTIVGPEGDLTTTYLEVDADSGRHAIAEAWKKVRPGFDLAEAQADDRPARDGWDAASQIVYVTPAAEQRIVVAVALGKARTWRVFLIDGKQAALGRRGAQLNTIIGSLRAPGVSRESWAARKANKLDDARLAAIDSFVEKAMKAADVPGAALAIVQDGKIVHERGFGVRELGKPAKVDPHTRFLTGSTGKSLMTLMMARAVDAGVFTWDTPVTRILPGFALGSAAVTSALLVRHTVCACTGMPRQDLEMLFEYDGATPEMRLASMKTMVPTTGFGETFQYSNMLVMAGGYAAAHALFPKLKLGPAYDRAMEEQVFKPLGMKDTTYDFQRAAKADHATPHARTLDGAMTAIPLSDETWVTTVRPAGGQWSSVDDYTRVLLLELGKGELDGKRFVSEATLLARRKPQVKINEDLSYGMGLVVGTEAGVPIVEHNGGTAGFTTAYFWLPEHGVGVVVVCNVGGDPFPDLVKRRVLEALFDGEPRAERDLAETVKQRKKTTADELGLLAPRLDQDWFAPLAGGWVAPGLGRIELKLAKGQLLVDAGEWKATAAEKVGKDGTRMIETTGAPFAGFEIVPEDRNGKRVLVVRDQQHEYVFEKVQK